METRTGRDNFIHEAKYAIGDIVKSHYFSGVIGKVTMIDASKPNIFYGVEGCPNYIPEAYLFKPERTA